MKKTITSMMLATCFLAACNSSQNNTSKGKDSALSILERNKQAVLSSEEGFRKKDANIVVKDCAADFVEYGDGTVKAMKNMDSIKAGVQEYMTAFPDYKGENLHAVAEGDTVIVTGIWSGTFKKEFMKMKPTGKSFKFPDAETFTLNAAGKITSHISTQSYFTLLYQVGVPLSPKK